MSIITIILFFVYTWGFGFTVAKIIKGLKESDNFLERNLMRVGIGLGTFLILGVLLNLLRIPLDWRIFLVLSIAFPIYYAFKKTKKEKVGVKQPKFKLTKSNLYILIVLLIFFVALFMYSSGAFSYPYLEDDDPWTHAVSVKYVSIEKNLNDEKGIFRFLDPYPPGYDLLMGVLHQTSPSVNWTLKFFNALIISLGIVFFYFFAKEFIGDSGKALFSTFVLAALPSFFTHFIWAPTLAVALMFPALYCLEKIADDKKWAYPAIGVIAGVMVVHTSESLKVGLMLAIYFIVKSLYEKKFLKQVFFAEVGGLALSFLWWFNKLGATIKRQIEIVSTSPKYAEIVSTTGESFLSRLKLLFPYKQGTASRAYSFDDFFVAKTHGMINVQIGWGIFITILLFLCLVYTVIKFKELFNKRNTWIGITLAWFIFTFLGTNSMTFKLPVGLFAFRFWLLLAVPVALLSPLGLEFAISLGKKVKIVPIMIIFVVILGILATSGYQKYYQNTQTAWPPGVSWTSMEEVTAYSWLKTLPIGTKVFMYAMYDVQIIGFDKYSCVWCDNVIEFKKNLIEKNADDLYSWLKLNKYEYIVISGMSYKSLSGEFGENKTKEVLDALPAKMAESGKFKVAYQNEGAIIFEVV